MLCPGLKFIRPQPPLVDRRQRLAPFIESNQGGADRWNDVLRKLEDRLEQCVFVLRLSQPMIDIDQDLEPSVCQGRILVSPL